MINANITSISTLLGYDFFIYALVVGACLAITFGLIGNLVVMRGEANISHTISHFALVGIALALLFELPLYPSMIFASLAGAGLVTLLKGTKKFNNDSINEMMAQGGLVTALVTLGFVSGYKSNIVNYLFGDILTVSSLDMTLAGGLALLTVLFFALFHSHLFQVSFHRELAISKGTNVSIINALYMLMLSLAIAVSIKIIGVLLVTAFMIIPPNISKLISRGYNQSFGRSVLFGLIGVVGGLYLSYVLNLPSGVVIVGVLIVVLLGMTLVTHRQN